MSVTSALSRGRRILGLIWSTDMCTVAQSIGAIGHHAIPGVEAGPHGEEAAVLGASFWVSRCKTTLTNWFANSR